MIGFMLPDSGRKLLIGERNEVSLEILRRNSRPRGSRHITVYLGYAQATLLAANHFAAYFYPWIDEYSGIFGLAGVIGYEYSQQHADLGSRQADAFELKHQLDHTLGQLRQPLIESGYRFGAPA